jgi:transposase
MSFDELSDEEWVRLSALVPEEPIRLNRRGRPRAECRVVANAVLWILTTGEPWSKLPGRYPSGPTCRRRFEEWLASGTLGEMVRWLAEQSGRTFAYVPPPPEPVAAVRPLEPAPECERLRGVFWQNPESWRLPGARGDGWYGGGFDALASDDASDGATLARAFAVPGAPARAARTREHGDSVSFATIAPQTDTYRGYTLQGIAQPVQNLMYRAWAEITQDERRVERSGLIGPRFTDAEAAEQYALDWARHWVDQHGVTDAPTVLRTRADASAVPTLAALAAEVAEARELAHFTVERRAVRGDGGEGPTSAAEPQYAYRVG